MQASVEPNRPGLPYCPQIRQTFQDVVHIVMVNLKGRLQGLNSGIDSPNTFQFSFQRATSVSLWVIILMLPIVFRS